jgi:hypothetical protein
VEAGLAYGTGTDVMIPKKYFRQKFRLVFFNVQCTFACK